MSREQRQFIQCVAALTMLIDHIGAVFFPTVIGFRAIGRLSFPLFAFGIAQGVTYTSDFRKYFIRILIAAVISQPIYMKLFGLDHIRLIFEEDALEAIAEEALARNTGARGLRSIIEGFMTKIMYEIPSRDDVERVVITADYVNGIAEPTLVLKTGGELPAANQ